MPSETHSPEPSSPYRIDQFEQTAPKKYIMWAAVALGALICGLFALLVFGGITREEWRAYAIGGPLLALLYFTVKCHKHFVRSPLLILLLVIPSAAMVLFFFGASDEIVLNKRGYMTDAVVTEVEKHARGFPTCRLEEPDGDPIHGSVACGDRKVGDRVTVTADPLGKVDPAEGSVNLTRVVVAFAICSYLIMLSTVLGAAVGIHRRGTIPPGWPLGKPPPRNYRYPSSPSSPPPIAPPGGREGAAGSIHE